MVQCAAGPDSCGSPQRPAAATAETAGTIVIDARTSGPEREAERIAAEVASGKAKPAPVGGLQPQLQRLSAPCASGTAVKVPAEVSAAISAPGAGMPLPRGVRESMEGSFGRDFSRVRLHAGESAARVSRHLQARAFTCGTDIWLGAGESPHDRRLMAHELTHVMQQEGSGAGKRVQRFGRCEELLQPPEGPYVNEHAVRESIVEEIPKSMPVATEFHIWGGSAACLRTEPWPKRSPFQNPVCPEYGAPPEYEEAKQAEKEEELQSQKFGKTKTYGRADIAALHGTDLELIEVKRASFCPGGITFAEEQLARLLCAAQSPEGLADVRLKWREKRGHGTINAVKAMPVNRFTPQPARRIHNKPVSVAWCNDGIMVFKVVGVSDKESFPCTNDEGLINGFLERVFDNAEMAVDAYIRKLQAQAAKYISEASLKEILRDLLEIPELRRRLPRALLKDGGEAMIAYVARELARHKEFFKKIALKFMYRVTAELRTALQKQIQNLLRESLAALCAGAAAKSAITVRELMEEFNRRLRQFAAILLPALAARVAAAVIQQIAQEVAMIVAKVVAVIIAAVLFVLAVLALWPAIVGGGAVAAMEAAAAAAAAVIAVAVGGRKEGS